MKNRAKCKLCQDIIESLHKHDYVTCRCGEISVDGGKDYFRCAAKDFDNFLRVDDDGNIIVPTIKTKEPLDDVKQLDIEKSKPTKKELVEMLENMIKSIEELPDVAMSTAINQYDMLSLMMLLSAVFKSDDKITE